MSSKDKQRSQAQHDRRVIKDLKNQLEATKASQADKLEKSKAHLVAQLRMAAEKYLTVNGYMRVCTVIREASFGDQEMVDITKSTAHVVAEEMSELATKLAEKIDAIDVTELDDSVLDGLLNKSFVASPFSFAEVVHQLLVVDLLQNVGPSIDDIVSFRGGSQEAIDKLVAELEATRHPLGQLSAVDEEGPAGGDA